MLHIGYYEQFPALVAWTHEYFELGSGGEKTASKTIGKFIEKLVEEDRIKPEQRGDVFDAVFGICESLCREGHMFCLHNSGGVGINNTYLSNASATDPSVIETELNSAVYGFEYVYHHYENLVFPILHIDENGVQQLGTGFAVPGGIATARHCLQGAKSLAIKGFPKDDLERCEIKTSADPDIDIAYITGPIAAKGFARISEARVTQEVLVMGYPKVPTFDVFLTAERALVSAIPTSGAVAAFAKSIFSRQKMMLITAKIRGGNSGGPVINSRGQVVGIACEIPDYSQENYDAVGYGAAAQSTELLAIMRDGVTSEELSGIPFFDYPSD